MEVDLLAVVYRLFDIIISGARYHLVATSNPSACHAVKELTFSQFRIILICLPDNRLESPRQPEITDLELTIRVYE
jgi:hypothetical protein